MYDKEHTQWNTFFGEKKSLKKLNNASQSIRSGSWQSWSWVSQLEWTETSISCPATFIETNSEQQQLDKPSWCLVHKYWELAGVTKDTVKESLNKNVDFPLESSHRKKARIHAVIRPTAAARCSLQSVSADSPMPAAVTQSPSVKFKTLTVLYRGWRSGP
jgi:hypothetical protein